MITYKLAPFWDRNEFGPFLNSLGLNGVGVEIGTHRGDFADVLCRTWKREHLNCIDPYITGYDGRDPLSHSTNRGSDYTWAKETLKRHDRVSLILQTSLAAATWVGKGQCIDFVYLDGNHQQDTVFEDIRAWWPLLSPGGILAGHDIIAPEPNEGYGISIQIALADYFRYDLSVFLVPEREGRPWSFFIRKPK